MDACGKFKLVRDIVLFMYLCFLIMFWPSLMMDFPSTVLLWICMIGHNHGTSNIDRFAPRTTPLSPNNRFLNTKPFSFYNTGSSC